MIATMTMDKRMSARGMSVYSPDGDKIASVEEIFVDEQTNEPEWIGLGTGTFGSKRVLVPVQGAELGEDALRVPYSKDQITATPAIDSDEISQESEAELYSHYGLDYSERRSETGLPEGAPQRGGAPKCATVGEGDDVRTEEQPQIGKRESDAASARLRKCVESEPV